MLSYLAPFLVSLLLAVGLTLAVRALALRYKIIDVPNQERKIQKQPVPLLGGLAIFLSFFLVLGYYAVYTNKLFVGTILPKHLIGIFLGGLFLMIGGALDDKYNLKPKYQIIWPVLAILAVIASGIGIAKVTNPLGGFLNLDTLRTTLFWFHGLPYRIFWLADGFTFLWLLGMMYTAKFLDGLDGLVSGVGVIGSLAIFSFTLFTKYFQPDVSLLAIIFAGACFGFLIFNFYPAKIFLGEGGSLFVGFVLGVLAIISGGKIAVTLLIIGLPALDVLWVILRRIFWEHRSPFHADKKHLHFRLLDLGFSQRQIVLLFYFVSIIFGATALFLQGKGKLLALLVLSIVMAILAVVSVVAYKWKQPRQ